PGVVYDHQLSFSVAVPVPARIAFVHSECDRGFEEIAFGAGSLSPADGCRHAGVCNLIRYRNYFVIIQTDSKNKGSNPKNGRIAIFISPETLHNKKMKPSCII